MGTTPTTTSYSSYGSSSYSSVSTSASTNTTNSLSSVGSSTTSKTQEPKVEETKPPSWREKSSTPKWQKRKSLVLAKYQSPLHHLIPHQHPHGRKKLLKNHLNKTLQHQQVNHNPHGKDQQPPQQQQLIIPQLAIPLQLVHQVLRQPIITYQNLWLMTKRSKSWSQKLMT